MGVQKIVQAFSNIISQENMLFYYCRVQIKEFGVHTFAHITMLFIVQGQNLKENL